jgi:hypothetical protein
MVANKQKTRNAMISCLITILSAMFAATTPEHRCLSGSKDALPDAKDAIDMDVSAFPNPLDGFEPPKVAMPYVIPPVTDTSFTY